MAFYQRCSNGERVEIWIADCEGDHGFVAWNAFASETGGGFDEGRLIRIDNDCGAFVGIPDFVEVARTNEVDVSEKLEEAPYEPQLVGLKVFTEEGKDAEQEIIITQVVAVTW